MNRFYLLFLVVYSFMVFEAICLFTVDWSLKGLVAIGVFTFWLQFLMDCDIRKPKLKRARVVYAPRVRVY